MWDELTLESEDLLRGVHDGRVCGDWPPHDLVRVREIDDHHIVLVAHTDEVVRLERERLERDGCGLDAESGELTGDRGEERERGGVSEVTDETEASSSRAATTLGRER